MIKIELISQLAKELELPRKEAALIINTVFDGISQSLAKGEKVEIRGFGSFRIKQTKPRMGRNPKTGEKIDIPAKIIPYFKVGKDLKSIR